MVDYKFSVARLELKQGGTLKKIINLTTEINIGYETSTNKKFGGNGVVQDEFTDTKQLTISVTYITDDFDISLIEGEEYDLFFLTGVGGGGIAVTLANCRLTKYEVTETQSEFATTILTFSKTGIISSIPGDSITKQTVEFTKEGGGTIFIGDSAYVNISYIGNTQAIVVPTALGILIQSTQKLGGGQIDIKINGYIKKNTRLELEQYLINLYSQLSTDIGTLTIKYGLTSYTIPNCYWRSGTPEFNNKNYTDFELTFIKSAF